jgi:hypothetical protein
MRAPGRRSLVIAATFASVVAMAAAPAIFAESAESPPAAAAARPWVRLRVRDDPADRLVEGSIEQEAADGGLLLETADQRLELIDGQEVISRETVEAPAEPESPRELGARVLRELPRGFDQITTRHYIICFDTTRAYAQWCGSLFERLHDAFVNFWQRAGVDVIEPDGPLIVVIFADRQRYEAHAAGDLGAAADRVVGYYNLLSNRITTFDLTGSDALARRPAGSAGRAGLEILAEPEAAGLVSTLVHEATHQMAFNCGLHRRLAPVPLWVSEGVATYFETPDLASSRGWRGVGGVNRPRLERFRRAYKPGSLAAVVLDDDSFRRADEAVDAYATGWALTAFLMQTRRAAFVDYIKTLAAKPALSADDRQTREQDFLDAFGVEPEKLEEPLLKFIARLR